MDSDVFKMRLLAKLDGHLTSNPPTICYVKESGCLVSGEKLNAPSILGGGEKSEQ